MGNPLKPCAFSFYLNLFNCSPPQRQTQRLPSLFAVRQTGALRTEKQNLEDFILPTVRFQFAVQTGQRQRSPPAKQNAARDKPHIVAFCRKANRRAKHIDPRSILPQGTMLRGRRYDLLNTERDIYHRPPRTIQDKTKKRAQLVKAVRVFILSQLI